MEKKTFRINQLFEQQFTTMGNAKTDHVIATSAKAPAYVGKKKPPITQHSKFQDDTMSESDFNSLKKKSDLTDIPLDILGEIFDRGVDAWVEDVNLSPQQFAFNRVNSFISKGRAYSEDDADLAELVESFGRRKEDRGDTGFRNWKFDIGVGQRTKVLTGDHKGKRGEVLGKIDGKDGPVYRIKHDDGTIMKHHISTLDEPEDRRKTGFGVRRVSEELEREELKPAPSIEQIAKKHNVDVSELKAALQAGIKVEGEHTKDKDIATTIALHHLNEKPNYYTKLKTCVEGLSEARPVNNPAYDHSEKMWDERKKFWEKREKEKSIKEEVLQEAKIGHLSITKTGKQWTTAHPDGKPTYDIHHNNEKIGTLEPYSAYLDKKRTGSRIVSSRKDVTRYSINFLNDKGPKGYDQGFTTQSFYNHLNPKHAHEDAVRLHLRWIQSKGLKEDLEESSNKPYIKPHYGDKTKPDSQTAWKASNKHGKVKYFGLDFKSAASKHAGIVEESMTHEEMMKEMDKYDAVMKKFGNKLLHTTSKHPGKHVSGYVVGHDPAKDGYVKLRVDHSSGIRKSGTSDNKDYSIHQDHLTDDHSKSALAEEVMAADRKSMIVRPTKKEITDPETGERKQINVKGHTKTTPTKRSIIKSGNLSDGKPSV